MELTANRRPFLSFPLKHHFEQQVHVRHRVQRYGAAHFMDYDSETPETIAAAITAEIGRRTGSLSCSTNPKEDTQCNPSHVRTSPS
jgi:hypothetical protein